MNIKLITILTAVILTISTACSADNDKPKNNVRFAATINSGPAMVTCEWKIGDKIIDTRHSFTYYLAPSTYTVKVKCKKDGNWSDERSRTFSTPNASVNEIIIAVD